MTQGRGSSGRGQHRRVGYHADAWQPGREHIPGHPGREHGARVQGPDLRPQHGADHGPRASRPAGTPSGRQCGLPARRSAAAARGPAGLTWRRPPGRPGRPDWRQRLPARRRTTVMPPRPRPHPGRRPAPTSPVQAPGYAPSRGRERAARAGRQHQCRTPRRRQRQRAPAPPRPHVISGYAGRWPARAVCGIPAARAEPIHPKGPATARQAAVRSTGTTRSAEHSGHHARNAGFLPVHRSGTRRARRR